MDRPLPLPRAPELAFDDVPRHWFGGSRVATHMVNSVNLLFPIGERFFVRSVRAYLDRIADDPQLLAEVRGFAGQEGRHAQAHERFFATLEAQGYRIRPFLETYERIFRWLEAHVSPEMRLSVTVALEHYTAIMAENALTDGLLDEAHPAVAQLLRWHATEEIEHKAVAFDVLRKVNPSYALRLGGLALGTVGLIGFWIAGALVLLSQERDWRGVAVEARRLRRERPIGKRVFARGIREYVRRNFHPWDNDNGALAREWLAANGFPAAQSASCPA
jgi:predicted metal-dependent hydrolase